MGVFRSSRLDAYFLTIIGGIENTERVASDFSNEYSTELNDLFFYSILLIYAKFPLI